jgi:hypothetical protein
MLYIAATLLAVVGLAHSYLGESYILMRLFERPNLPKLFGGTAFTTGTLRFAWHLNTVAWWGLAYLVIRATSPDLNSQDVLRIIAAVVFVSGLFPLYFTRGKHLSWLVFFLVAALIFLSSA